MKDLDISNKTGYLNVETSSDGGAGIYVNPDDSWGTMKLDKEEVVRLATWLITWIEKNK